LVNGKIVEFEAYNINGYNYFKLRDLAQAVNNTEKNFEVTWDAANNAINLISNNLTLHQAASWPRVMVKPKLQFRPLQRFTKMAGKYS